MDTSKSYIATCWWKSMALNPTELKKQNIQPAPSVYKAQLKRCESAEAAMLTEGFKALWFALPEELTKKSESMLCWATIAAVLVYVKTASAKDIASAAGKITDSKKPVVSELRFSQLQNARTPEDLLRRMRRIIQQIKGDVSPELLVQDLERWFAEHYVRPRRADRRIAVHWAMNYYRAASDK